MSALLLHYPNIDEVFDSCDDLHQRFTSVSKQHRRISLVEEIVVYSGKTRAEAALQNYDLPSTVHIENGIPSIGLPTSSRAPGLRISLAPTTRITYVDEDSSLIWSRSYSLS